MAHVMCESCHRWLREEDAPLCADCAANQRTERAQKAAEARWEPKPVHTSVEKRETPDEAEAPA